MIGIFLFALVVFWIGAGVGSGLENGSSFAGFLAGLATVVTILTLIFLVITGAVALISGA